MNEELYNSLCNSLNARSGTLQSNDLSDDVFRIKWPRNISFTVHGNQRYGWFYVERDKQQVSSTFRYYKVPDSRSIGIMQNLIDEAETGKYNNKKTLSDRIREAVQQRQLTSCMNNTKWRELLNDLAEIPNLSIRYYMNMAEVEWFAIDDTIRESTQKGLLLDPEISEESVKDKIEGILKNHNIYFEYEIDSGVFTVFGYKAS